MWQGGEKKLKETPKWELWGRVALSWGRRRCWGVLLDGTTLRAAKQLWLPSKSIWPGMGFLQKTNKKGHSQVFFWGLWLR